MAREMKEKYGDKIDLKIYLSHSEEAQKYKLKSAASALVDEELIPLDVATDKDRMNNFLSEKMGSK